MLSEVAVATLLLAAAALARLRAHLVLIPAMLALPHVNRRLGGAESHFLVVVEKGLDGILGVWLFGRSVLRVFPSKARCLRGVERCRVGGSVQSGEQK